MITPLLEKTLKRKRRIKKITEALEKEGYFVANLWHIDDVKGHYNCSDEQAQEILYEALTNDRLYDTVWESIHSQAEDEGLIKKDH